MPLACADEDVADERPLAVLQGAHRRVPAATLRGDAAQQAARAIHAVLALLGACLQFGLALLRGTQLPTQRLQSRLDLRVSTSAAEQASGPALKGSPPTGRVRVLTRAIRSWVARSARCVSSSSTLARANFSFLGLTFW